MLMQNTSTREIVTKAWIYFIRESRWIKVPQYISFFKSIMYTESSDKPV